MSRLKLVDSITCPHCWQKFAPEEVLWISEHADLMGDLRVGSSAQRRFLPSRFNLQGNALDARGFPCTLLACPHCHLGVPRALLEMSPMFMSVLGAPACGKSYFLTAMTWRLRHIMPKYFVLAFGDADPVSNRILNDYEELLFLNSQKDALVALRKTELQGDLYDTVMFGHQLVSFPRPFSFVLSPLENHPNAAKLRTIARVVCIYDNAGEHFLPGSDTSSTQATRHLAQSNVLFFLFDPMQDPRMIQRMRKGGEPAGVKPVYLQGVARQESVLHEIADRLRRYLGLSITQKFDRPLVVVVTKYDAWSHLLDEPPLSSPCVKRDGIGLLNVQYIESISDKLRALLWRTCPEIVATAEHFAQQVVYMPVSALGRAPEKDPRTGLLGIAPDKIKPAWPEVPLLYSLCRWQQGVIPAAVKRA